MKRQRKNLIDVCIELMLFLGLPWNQALAASTSWLPVEVDIPQQQRRVTGIVKDTSGEPIVGANVLEKGTTNGTVTDINGNFALDISGNITLIISYIGYDTQEVSMEGKSALSIILKEDAKLLGEVVVLGYGANARKQDLSASVGVVSNAEELAVRPVTSTEGMLQGQLAGVTIQSNGGDPTHSLNIVIRGQGSQTVSYTHLTLPTNSRV